MKRRLPSFLTALFMSLIAFTNAAAQTDRPIVQAILFYSPTCPHCHKVINELLLPMQDEYGDQLQILGVDTTKEAGQQLYQIAVQHFNIPQERLGVPTLIIADTVMVGEREIPEQFPQLVEEGLAAGGVGWPDIPDLRQIVPNLAASAGPNPTENADGTGIVDNAGETSGPEVETAVSGIAANLSTETTNPTAPPEGAGLAWLVMAGMAAALVFAAYQMLTTRNFDIPTPTSGRTLAIFLLTAVGLIVSIYLSYIEISHNQAVCGPVGDCNTVQAGDYAQIWGIPVAVLGALNYLAIALLWIGLQFAPHKQRQSIWWALVGITLLGTFFSIYLTALELFVIHAVCAWCLTSAVVTAVLLVVVVGMVVKRPYAQQTTSKGTAVS